MAGEWLARIPVDSTKGAERHYGMTLEKQDLRIGISKGSAAPRETYPEPGGEDLNNGFM
jgi:hypothetical protein